MGYFGKSITASDKYCDFESDLLTFLGYKFNDSHDYDPDDYKPHVERLGKEAFEGKVEDINDWMISHQMDIEEGIFLGYHLLIRGVEVTNERLDKFIGFCNDDEWAKTDIERRIYMKLAAEAFEKYKTDKTPVDIDIEYDLENYYIQRRWDNDTRQVPSVEDIIELFEKYIEININGCFRNKHVLYLVMSNEDYKKIDGQSTMGIKFITPIK